MPPLRGLHGAGHEIALVVTGADRRRGRGSATSPSPVSAAASELGLPVSHTVDDVLTTGADLGVVVAFGRLIRPHVLAAVPMVNVHFSLLPRWRGAAPVERALLAGDPVTGVCIMAVDETLDTGDVYRRAEVPIGDRVTAAELRANLVDVGPRSAVSAWAWWRPSRSTVRVRSVWASSTAMASSVPAPARCGYGWCARPASGRCRGGTSPTGRDRNPASTSATDRVDGR